MPAGERHTVLLGRALTQEELQYMGYSPRKDREEITIPCLCGRTHVVVIRWERPMVTITANIGNEKEK